MWANNRGRVSSNSSNQIFEIQNVSYSFTKKRFSFDVHTDLLLRISNNNSIHFSQAFIKAQQGNLALKAGIFYNEQGLNSNELGIGSMLISRNASAIPGIYIETPSYQSVPFTKQYIKFNVGFGNFWYDKNRFVNNAQLHSKHFYIRGDFSSLKVTAGLVHNVQWGGTTPDGTSLGNSANDYLRIIFGASASKNIAFQEEIINTLGNTVAAYDAGIEWKADFADVSINRLFFMEDKSNIMLRSFWDGQWSFNALFKNNDILKRLRYDYMYTIRQDAVGEQPGGRANYYGHYLYQSGWTYRNNVLGNPFIEFDFENNKTINNVMIVHSLATQFSIWDNGNITTKSSYKRSYGVCSDLTNSRVAACVKGSVPEGEVLDNIPRNTLRKDQFQLFIKLEQQFNRYPQVIVNLLGAYDVNPDISNNFGLGIGIKYLPNF